MTRGHDVLPEHYDYRDEGCELASACLSCPFDRCQYDVDKRRFSRVPSEAVLEARKAGVRREDQAQFYGVTPRHISRILAKARLAEQEAEAC